MRRRARAAAGVGNREAERAGRSGAAGGPYPDRISLAEEGCGDTERSRTGRGAPGGGNAPAPPQPRRGAPTAPARRPLHRRSGPRARMCCRPTREVCPCACAESPRVKGGQVLGRTRGLGRTRRGGRREALSGGGGGAWAAAASEGVPRLLPRSVPGGGKETGMFFLGGGFVSGAALEFGLGAAVEPSPVAQRGCVGSRESVHEGKRTERACRTGYTGLALQRQTHHIPVHTFTLGRDAGLCARGLFGLLLTVFCVDFCLGCVSGRSPALCLLPLARSSVL